MKYKTPNLTVDGAIIKDKKILLIKRKKTPFKDKWALPGGFVEYGEKTEAAVIREVYEETGLKTMIIDLIGIYSDPNRDPRGHMITIVYYLKIISGSLKSGDDASDVNFFNFFELPELAFDHNIIISDVANRMR